MLNNYMILIRQDFEFIVVDIFIRFTLILNYYLALKGRL